MLPARGHRASGWVENRARSPILPHVRSVGPIPRSCAPCGDPAVFRTALAARRPTSFTAVRNDLQGRVVMARFRDRRDAGRFLARKLLAFYARRPDVIVLALPR